LEVPQFRRCCCGVLTVLPTERWWIDKLVRILAG
jgi:hypothetical protein